MEACLCATLLVICCVLVGSELSCEQTQFLGPDGTCVACPACGPGEQLSEDCGFGDSGAGVCVPCDAGTFSVDAGVAPCVRCTQCGLLNRQERTACSPTGDAQCGRCLPGYYELRGLTGEVEPSCVPCSGHHTAQQECLGLSPRGSKIVTEEPALVALTASSALLSALLLWAFLLAAWRLSQRLEVLDHDSVQDMSLLLGPTTSQDVLRRLGRSLGVLTQVAAHSPGLSGPLPVPAYLYPHPAAPAGPGSCAPAQPQNCCPDTQSSCGPREHVDPTGVLP